MHIVFFLKKTFYIDFEHDFITFNIFFIFKSHIKYEDIIFIFLLTCFNDYKYFFDSN